jgi:pimeloyl-ACP methyl ester carboxylesterase
MEKYLILLHGALGSAAQLEPLKNELKGNYQVHSFNWIGHGGTPIPADMCMENLVDQLINYIHREIPPDAQLTLFGYSMGGYAALMLASRNIFPLQQIITLGTKLYWSPEIALKEIGMLNPETIEQKLPAFAKELELRHAPQDWKKLMSATADLMTDLGANHYLKDEVLAGIEVPCKLMIGDRDKMMSLQETIEGYRKLSQASLSILPNTPHPIERVSLARMVFELTT